MIIEVNSLYRLSMDLLKDNIKGSMYFMMKKVIYFLFLTNKNLTYKLIDYRQIVMKI